METITVYRKANVTSAEATKTLFDRFPGAELLGFKAKKASADEAVAAKAATGELVYEATLRLAEFPPKKDDGGEEASANDSADDAPSESSDSGNDSEESDSSDSSDSSDGSKSDTPFGSGDDDKGGEDDSKLKGDTGIIHVLTEILHALKGDTGPVGAGPDDGLGGPGDLGGAPDLPDVGAPGQGEALPPPHGPGGGAPPLPPPVPEKAPVPGGAFSHYDPGVAQITVLRRDSHELGNKAMIAEAAELYPTHRVARIQRTGAALVNGLAVDLPTSKAAVVTLVRK